MEKANQQTTAKKEANNKDDGKMKFAPLSAWGLNNYKRPLVISGPCSAETEEQVRETAAQLEGGTVEIFRAGIWKPRTRPGSFEGVGEKGLSWMQKVKEETSLKVATEVANANHVNLALKYNLDVLWIGARTSANPFAMQEIADALHGRDVAVMIKNPINPDLGLWVGAIERIYKAGIRRIAAIHRGFSSSAKSRYRNPPEWQLPVDLRRKLPDIPIINDPSHIGGSRDLLFDVSQKAMDLSFDGLIIESHIAPDEAWSDAKQQITPGQLHEMLDRLVLPNVHSEDDIYLHNIEELRAKIDKFDEELLALLGERMEITKTIGKYKKANNITILQPDRWGEILTKNIEQGKSSGLSEEFLTKLFKCIHQESINKQTQIMRSQK